jgi:adenosine kinase
MIQLAEECRQNHLRFIYDPSQQVPRLSGDELLQSMDGAYAMVVNAYEAEVISKKTGKSLDDLRREIDILVVTHGPRGSVIYHGDQQIDVPVFPVSQIKDPTGGGDAYRAGLIRGLASGWPLKLAGEVGALCAAYNLEHVGTQNHQFTIPEFVARFRTQFDDGGLLESLIAQESV